MTDGRTTSRWTRVYMDGYDVSGDSRQIGPLLQTYDENEMTCFSHTVKGYLPAHVQAGVGTLNGTFNNTATTGLHIIANGAGVMRNVIVAQGMRTDPAQGDPCYMGEFEQAGYYADLSGVYVTVPMENSSARASTFLYERPWGWLLRPATSTTAVNSSTGIDDYGAATAFGGYMSYQVLAGNGTATIKVQDAATNADGSFSDLSGATSGSINCAVVQYGRIALGRTATVRRYLRWQIVLGTATSVTFVLGFSRALV